MTSATLDDFPQFLESHGIFNSKQRTDYSTETSSTSDESATIFQLADFFRSLTPSECYDLALRIYLLYQQSKKDKSHPKNTKKSEAAQKLQTIVESTQPATANDSKEKPRSSGPYQNTHRSNVNFLDGSLEQMWSIQQSLSSQRAHNASKDSIHERLYNESYVKNNMKIIREEVKKQEELKGCTFHPTVTEPDRSRSPGKRERSPEQVFERLARDNKNTNQSLYEEKRKELEMKECTFKPNITQSSPSHERQKTQFEFSEKQLLNQTFERLHSEKSLYIRRKIANERERQEREIIGCTFSPKINKRGYFLSPDGRSSKEMSRVRSEALYSDYFERERHKTKVRLDIDQEESKRLTFKPELISKSMVKLDPNVPTEERLLSWERERVRKLEESKEQKRKSESAEKRPRINRESPERAPRTQETPKRETYNRLYQDSALKKERTKEREKKLMEELGCTFSPKLNTSGASRTSLHSRGGQRMGDKSEGALHKTPDRSTVQDSKRRNLQEIIGDKENVQAKPLKGLTPAEQKKVFQQNLWKKLQHMKVLYDIPNKTQNTTLADFRPSAVSRTKDAK